MTAGANQTATVGTAYGTAFAVKATDASGNPVSGVTITFAAPSSGARGTFANATATTTAVTGSSGIATASAFTANSTPGTYAVTASTTGVGPASIAVANTTTGTSLSATPTSGPAGTSVTVSGSGFDNNSSVTTTLGTTVVTLSGGTGVSGSLSNKTFTVPPLPAGTYLLTVTDSGSGNKTAATTFTVTTSLSASPSSGSVGASATLTGSGFAANAALTVTLGAVHPTITSGGTTSSSGAVSTIFTVPSSSPGSYALLVSDGTNQVSTTFTVTAGSAPAASWVVAGNAGSGTSVSASLSLAASTSYVVFVATESKVGDSIAMTSSGLGSPTITKLGSDLTFDVSTADAYVVTNNGTATGSGTITATFQQSTSNAYIEVVRLSGNDPTTPVVLSTIATAGSGSTKSSPATANMSNTTSTNGEVVFVSAESDAGAGTPSSSSSALTNLTYAHSPSGSALVYAGSPPQSSESISIGSNYWGTIALEIKAPSTAVATLNAASPSSGAVGSTVTLSGSGFTNGSTLSATFGSRTVPITGATWNGSGGFSGATITVPWLFNGANTIVVADATHQAATTFTVTGSVSGLTFNWTSGGTMQSCTASGATTTCNVNLGNNTLVGTLSLYSGSSPPGTAVTNGSGATFTLTPTVGNNSTATTATLASGTSTSTSVSITKSGLGSQTISYAVTYNGVTVTCNVVAS